MTIFLANRLYGFHALLDNLRAYPVAGKQCDIQFHLSIYVWIMFQLTILFNILTVALMAASVWSASRPRRLEVHARVVPADDGLHEGIRPPARGNGDGIVGQHREGTAQVRVNFPKGTHKRIILSVARRPKPRKPPRLFHLQRRHRLQPLRQRKRIIQNANTLVCHRIMMQHVADDIRQIIGRHHLFLVAQLDDALGHLTHRIFVDVDAQRLEVLADIRLARRLAEGILADAPQSARAARRCSRGCSCCRRRHGLRRTG